MLPGCFLDASWVLPGCFLGASWVLPSVTSSWSHSSVCKVFRDNNSNINLYMVQKNGMYSIFHNLLYTQHKSLFFISRPKRLMIYTSYLCILLLRRVRRFPIPLKSQCIETRLFHFYKTKKLPFTWIGVMGYYCVFTRSLGPSI